MVYLSMTLLLAYLPTFNAQRVPSGHRASMLDFLSSNDALKPFRNEVVVGCECMFAWYWLVAFESGDIDFNQYPEMNLDVAPVPGWK